MSDIFKSLSSTAKTFKPHIEKQLDNLKDSCNGIKPVAEKYAESMKPRLNDIRHTAEEALHNVQNAIMKAEQEGRQFLADHKDEIKQAQDLAKEATNSAAGSVFQFASDTFNYKSNRDRLEKLKARIQEQSAEYANIVNQPGTRMVDSIFVGGDLLSDILRTGASPEVHEAYTAAFPEEAKNISFEDFVRSKTDDSINGTISAVKGKLFEQEYVTYLNEGHLPDGYSADLAHSATQPGWDIAIHGPDGHIAEVLQLKATDSVSYVQHAMERYPGIDVVTTDEVYSHLLMNGASDHSSAIIDSHIANSSLTDTVTDSIDSSAYHMHWTPPVLSLAMIAFTMYSLKDATAYEKASHFGNRAGKSYLTYLVGGGVMAMTQTWWLGLIAGIGTRYLAGQSAKMRDVCDELEGIVVRNDEVLKKLRMRLT